MNRKRGSKPLAEMKACLPGTLFACLLILAAAALPAFAQDSPDRPVILAIGESTTAGYGVPPDRSYPAQLAALLAERGYDYEVVNHGRSGSTTGMALGGLHRGLRLGPEIVIIALGGNDRGNGLAAERTRENLRKLVSIFTLAGARVFLADRGRADGNDEGGPSLFAELAREEGAVLIPSLREGLAGRPEYLLSDGSHPNAEGYAIISERLFGILEPWLEKTASPSR